MARQRAPRVIKTREFPFNRSVNEGESNKFFMTTPVGWLTPGVCFVHGILKLPELIAVKINQFSANNFGANAVAFYEKQS